MESVCHSAAGPGLDEQLRLSEPPASGLLFGRGLRLLRDAESSHYAIFLGSVPLFEWAEDDRATRRLVMAQLVNAKLARRVEVARVFGTAPQYRLPDCATDSGTRSHRQRGPQTGSAWPAQSDAGGGG